MRPSVVRVPIWPRQAGLLTSLSLCSPHGSQASSCTAGGGIAVRICISSLLLPAWSLDEPTPVRSWSFPFLPVAALSPHLKVEMAFGWVCKIWLGLKTVFYQLSTPCGNRAQLFHITVSPTIFCQSPSHSHTEVAVPDLLPCTFTAVYSYNWVKDCTNGCWPMLRWIYW